MNPKIVTLNEIDNVYICCRLIKSGEQISIDGEEYIMKKGIEIGHKIARSGIKIGEKIVRYGVPIGSATSDIVAGEHVHIHNMKSDYIPSHTRQSRVGEER